MDPRTPQNVTFMEEDINKRRAIARRSRVGCSGVVTHYSGSAGWSVLDQSSASKCSVTVVTVGAAAATKELRTAMAMGADNARHVVTDEELGPEATATALAAAMKEVE